MASWMTFSMVSCLTGRVGTPSVSFHSSKVGEDKTDELQEMAMFSKTFSFMNTLLCTRRMSVFVQRSSARLVFRISTNWASVKPDWAK